MSVLRTLADRMSGLRFGTRKPRLLWHDYEPGLLPQHLLLNDIPAFNYG
jgi:hypothetical protein